MKKCFIECLCIAFGLISCMPTFADISSQSKHQTIYRAKSETYSMPVWISGNTIVFNVISTIKPNNDDPISPKIISYDTNRRVWTRVVFVKDPDCPFLIFDFLQRLPDHQLGFVSSCTNQNEGETRTIQEMDVASGEIKTLIGSGPLHIAGQFAFSSSMTELVQEDMSGRYLSNKLFYRHEGDATQIVSNFIRAMYPSWSPSERKVAFWGTDKYAGEKPGDLTSLPEISALATYPFDLFIATPEGANPQKLLSSVQNPLPLKWSPASNVIAFAGDYQGESGIWLFEPATAKITRVWSTASDFDWSPDGRKIIVVQNAKDSEGKISSQEIILVFLK